LININILNYNYGQINGLLLFGPTIILLALFLHSDFLQYSIVDRDKFELLGGVYELFAVDSM